MVGPLIYGLMQDYFGKHNPTLPWKINIIFIIFETTFCLIASYYRYYYTDYGLYLAPRISHCEPAAGRCGNPFPFVFASICLFSVRIDSFFLKCYNPLEISFGGKVCLITADKKSKLLP